MDALSIGIGKLIEENFQKWEKRTQKLTKPDILIDTLCQNIKFVLLETFPPPLFKKENVIIETVILDPSNDSVNFYSEDADQCEILDAMKELSREENILTPEIIRFYEKRVKEMGLA